MGDHCDGCGFTYGVLTRRELPDHLRSFAAPYRERLEGPEVRRRPGPEVWSPLEYACHVRDVATVQRERIGQALAEDCPTMASMEREARARIQRYNEQDPAAVAAALADALSALADRLQSLTGEEWDRTVIYNYPVRAVRSVEWIGDHTVHECRHHLRDITTPAG